MKINEVKGREENILSVVGHSLSCVHFKAHWDQCTYTTRTHMKLPTHVCTHMHTHAHKHMYTHTQNTMKRRFSIGTGLRPSHWTQLGHVCGNEGSIIRLMSSATYRILSCVLLTRVGSLHAYVVLSHVSLAIKTSSSNCSASLSDW